MNKKILIIIIVISGLSLSGCVLFPSTTRNMNEVLPADDTETSQSEDNRQKTGQSSDSPFGVFTGQGIFKELADVGAKAIRYAAGEAIIWEPDKKTDWSRNDKAFLEAAKNNMEISVVVLTGTANPANSKDDLRKYSQFLKEAAERYDGDGDKDAQGSPIVKYWEIDNEPDFKEINERTPWNSEIAETKDYALALKAAYQAIKSTNPKAEIAIAGMAYNTEYYAAIFDELEKIKDKPNDIYFDVFNYHYYGNYKQYLQTEIDGLFGKNGPSLSTVKSLLNKHNYGNRIILTEVGTYRSSPNQPGMNSANQTEKVQADNLVKKYIYSIANGAERIYWTWPQQNNSNENNQDMFQTMALTYGNSKTLAFYSYKKMVDMLDQSDWSKIEKISEQNGIYIYKFIKDDAPIWVAWNDGEAKKNITIPDIAFDSIFLTSAVPDFEIGKEITNFNSAFRIETKKVQNQKITLMLTETPIFISSKTQNNNSGINTNNVNKTIIEQPSSENDNMILPPGKKCGDGICDGAEIADPNLCPQDCKQ